MRKTVLVALLTTLLSGCFGLPTLDATATTIPTTPPTTITPTAVHMPIVITGDVYVRDDQGNVVGWLYKDEEVQATCLGNWCKIDNGIFRGASFWRGCSSDNPDGRSCQSR